MQREDSTPWYRQFWPWFIIALPASAVIGGLVTLWIAMQTDDSLVFTSDDGINVVTERHLAAERIATTAGVAAVVHIDIATGAVIVTLESDTALAPPASLLLQFLHPTRVQRDVEIELLRAMPTDDGQQTWAGHFVTVPSGRFYAVLSSGDHRADDTWRLSGEWSDAPVLRLGTTAHDGE